MFEGGLVFEPSDNTSTLANALSKYPLDFYVGSMQYQLLANIRRENVCVCVCSDGSAVGIRLASTFAMLGLAVL